MDAEDFSIDNGSQRQVIEHFSTILPRVRVSVLPVDLVKEPVHLSDLP